MLSGLVLGMSALSVVLMSAMVVGGTAVLARSLVRHVRALGEVRRLERLWSLDAAEPRDRRLS